MRAAKNRLSATPRLTNGDRTDMHDQLSSDRYANDCRASMSNICECLIKILTNYHNEHYRTPNDIANDLLIIAEAISPGCTTTTPQNQF